MIAILDYGMGNLRSVQKAFEKQGLAAVVISRPEEVLRAERLVLPGVGAFKDAMAVLEMRGLSQAIRDFVRTGRPMLGICLGMQLLVDTGYEDGRHRGLGIVRGECVRFTVDHPPLKLKVPHMGWNALKWSREVPLLRGVAPGSHVYFVHSYHVVPAEARVIACTADYGGDFVAALWQDNVVAAQFHPEKSQAVGGVILGNFARM